MGLVYQLSTASCCKHNINVKGFAFGRGAYSTLLGFNVIGSAIAWALCGLTLLENSDGSNLVLSAAAGNNVVKFLKRVLMPLDMLLGGRKTAELPTQGPIKSCELVNKSNLESKLQASRLNSTTPLQDHQVMPQGV